MSKERHGQGELGFDRIVFGFAITAFIIDFTSKRIIELIININQIGS